MFDGRMNILGVGVDLCAVSRMEALLQDDRFLDRFFTPGEKEYIRSKGKGAAQTMAGIFAAKEAALKAMGTGITIPLQAVEVTHTPAGAPEVSVHVEKSPGTFHLSIAHEGDMAVAFAVLSAAVSLHS